MTGRMKETGAKGIRKKQAREKNGLALDQKFTDRSELRQREHGEVQIMAARKPSKKFICMSFISKCVGHRTNGWERDWLSVVASSALPWFTFLDLLSTFVFQNESLKLRWSSEVTPSHSNVNWEVSLRLALSHKGTTHAAACGKKKSSLNTGKPVADLQSNQLPKWEVICGGQGNTSGIQTCSSVSFTSLY